MIIEQNFMATSQLLQFNPIINETESIQNYYKKNLINFLFKELNNKKDINLSYIKKWNQAEYEFYCNFLNYKKENRNHSITELKKYNLFLIPDIAIMLGLNLLPYLEKAETIETNIVQQLARYRLIYYFYNILPKAQLEFGIHLIDSILFGKKRYWDKLKEYIFYKEMASYLTKIENNLNFIEKKPFQILVTALMSAGKSTFINALTGKNICKAQNLSCTSKIHSIISKQYEDGFIYKHDYDLKLKTETDEILKNNERNLTDNIYISTYYKGELAGERIIIHDSPGVNSSQDLDHKTITYNMVKSKKYDLLVYIINATQIGTDGSDEYLKYLKDNIEDKNIIFVLNQIDMFDPEKDSIETAIESCKKFLQDRKFKNPIICPVSSKAGYLVYKNKIEKLNRSDKTNLYNLIDKFESEIDLVKYYNKEFPNISINNRDTDEEQLLKTCGIAYIENIIKSFIK